MKEKGSVGLVLLLLVLPGLILTADAGGPIGGPFLIGDQPVDAVYPAVAYNTDWQQYLVVWFNDRPGNDDVYGQLLDRQGGLIGGWRAIAAGQGMERRYPDVAYNTKAKEYLVVWEQYDPGSGEYSILGKRVAADGEPLGGEIPISEAGPYSGVRPAVGYAYTSDRYLVVWENLTQGSVSNDIKGQVLGSGGALEGGNFFIAQGTWQFSMERPDLAYNRRGNGYLVVWQQLDKNISIYDIYGRLVHGDGNPMPPESIELNRVSWSSMVPAVAAIPTVTALGQYFVVWEAHFAPGDRNIAGRAVAGDGTPQPSFHIAASGMEEYRPTVAGNENNQEYLVAWSRPLGYWLIYGRTVSSVGPLTKEVRLGGYQWAEKAAAAGGSLGDFLVAYDDPPPWSMNRNVYGRLWGNRVYLPLVVRHP